MPDEEREIILHRLGVAMGELSKCAHPVSMSKNEELTTLLYHAGMTLKSLIEKLEAQRDNRKEP